MERLYTIREACQTLRSSHDTLWKLRNQGYPPGRRLGGRALFTKSHSTAATHHQERGRPRSELGDAL
jgi:hypothetical protein